MVRTKAENACRKAVAAKAPRKSTGGGSSAANSSCYESPSRNVVGSPLINHAKMWPTPTWQKGIKCFFPKNENQKCPSETSCGSSSGSQLTPEDTFTEANTGLLTQTTSKLVAEPTMTSLSDRRSLYETGPLSPSSSTFTSSPANVSPKRNTKHKRRIVMDIESDSE